MGKYDFSALSEGQVRSINISGQKDTPKIPIQDALLTGCGLENDSYNSISDIQVSMLKNEVLFRQYEKNSIRFEPGDFTENITVEGFENINFNLLDRFLISDAIIEITKIGRKSKDVDSTNNQTIRDAVISKDGIFLRVLKPGVIKQE